MWKPKKWMPIVVWKKFMDWWSDLNGFGVAGMTLPLLIILRYDGEDETWTDRKRKWFKGLVNHEGIHIMQQVELLVVGFFLAYGINYLVNRIKGMDHKKAYYEIIFEREAYDNQDNYDYIDGRKWFAPFRSYWKSSK